MAGLSRILSIATLIVHLMVGCCSHHAQGCESKDRSAATSEPTLDGRCPQCGCESSRDRGLPAWQMLLGFSAPHSCRFVHSAVPGILRSIAQ